MEAAPEALKRAIDLLGGTVAAAKTLKLKSYQTLQQWAANGVPPKWRAAIERETRGAVRVEAFGDDVRWYRIKDRSWPWNGGRPAIDIALMEAA